MRNKQPGLAEILILKKSNFPFLKLILNDLKLQSGEKSPLDRVEMESLNLFSLEFMERLRPVFRGNWMKLIVPSDFAEAFELSQVTFRD